MALGSLIVMKIKAMQRLQRGEKHFVLEHTAAERIVGGEGYSRIIKKAADIESFFFLLVIHRVSIVDY
jgi:hypothetical protein